ncbi:MAG: hypothetical protein GEU88_09340 [Solirubrobacterales bacterium]|nr:hypothetical protein [Solirubrobacterales bacterium]
MIGVVAGELLKLRTTRTFYGIVLGTLALVLVISLLAGLLGDFERGDTPGRDLLSIAALAQTFTLVFGILAVSTEFRHGTITPSLLVVPSRARLVSAKLVAHLGAGLLIGLAAYALCALVVDLALGSRDIEPGFASGEPFEIIVGGAVAAGLFAALGVGLGALVRNQVGAIVGALAWTFVVESLLTAILGSGSVIGRLGLNGLGAALPGTNFGESTGDLLAPVPAGLVLGAYAAVLLVAGVLVLRRRDVSA